MKRLALAAAGVAVIGLTACSHSAAPGAAPTTHHPATPIAPVSCSKQYRTWTNGPGKGVMVASRGQLGQPRPGTVRASTRR